MQLKDFICLCPLELKETLIKLEDRDCNFFAIRGNVGSKEKRGLAVVRYKAHGGKVLWVAVGREEELAGNKLYCHHSTSLPALTVTRSLGSTDNLRPGTPFLSPSLLTMLGLHHPVHPSDHGFLSHPGSFIDNRQCVQE